MHSTINCWFWLLTSFRQFTWVKQKQLVIKTFSTIIAVAIIDRKLKCFTFPFQSIRISRSLLFALEGVHAVREKCRTIVKVLSQVLLSLTINSQSRRNCCQCCTSSELLGAPLLCYISIESRLLKIQNSPSC